MKSDYTGTCWRQRLRRLSAVSVSSVTLAAAGVWSSVPAQAAAPDLIVTNVRPVLSGIQATGSEVTFQATIKNQGTAATPAGVIHGVAFAINGTTVSWSDTSTASLAAGASRTVTANGGPDGNSTWTAGNGNYTLRARVDDVRRIAEGNEGNNDRAATVSATPVKAPTGVTARPAVTQDQFDLAHARTVRVGWTVPSGQPVGVRYTVTEHPVDPFGGWCPDSMDMERATTTRNSTAFDMEAGRYCGNHGAESYVDTYSVTAASINGGPPATSARSGQCEWASDGHDQFMNYWFDCGGVLLFDAVTGGSRIDAGAVQDSFSYEKDQGFTGGTPHTSSFSDLSPVLRTSRWGFTKYTLHTDYPGVRQVAIRMVEPTFTAAGRRVFDLRVNGVLVASNIDIFAKVGRGHEYTVWADVEAPNGVIEIVPTKKVDNPIVAAIEIH